MINLLLGPPGAGKTYEAVVFHILPALLSGRKVITNLPLNIPQFVALGIDADLIELRQTSIENPRPFGNPDDYGSEWRGVGGIGPLYVIDECHKPLPKGMTSRLVEEWFAEHRHEGADCILITQSFGKISQSIRDMVQVVYRVRKATALGSDKSYIRKVQDGLRGEVMNENLRKYNPDRFVLYQSHTKSMGSVLESKANDIKPIWKHWSMIGAAFMLPIGLVTVLYFGAEMFWPSVDAAPVVVAEVVPVKREYVPHNLRSVEKPLPVAVATPKEVKEPPPPDHPFIGLGLHIRGSVVSFVPLDHPGQLPEKSFYLISASQNGQAVFDMSNQDMLAAGYTFESLTPCLANISYGKFQKFITCNSPSQTTM
jgi:zona occludens toxin